MYTPLDGVGSLAYMGHSFFGTQPPLGDAAPAHQLEAAFVYLAKKTCARGASNQRLAPCLESVLPPDYSLILVNKES
jgi:hypothetical protein